MYLFEDDAVPSKGASGGEEVEADYRDSKRTLCDTGREIVCATCTPSSLFY